MTNVEQFIFSSAGNVTLTNGLVAGSSLPDNFFSVMGSAGADTVDGSAITSKRLNIASGGGIDTLMGGSLNDVLDGGLQADTMTGGLGDDVYYVNDPGDVVTENPGGGSDIVNSSIDYTLPANVEAVVLIEGAGPLNAVGNSADNALIGNSQNNTLQGLGGNDFMVGGAGDDIYIVDSSADEVVENANEGGDIVYASIDYTIGLNVESVVLIEGAGLVNAAGSSINNALIGNSLNNTLDGRGGDDFMVGGLGNDVYVVEFHGR